MCFYEYLIQIFCWTHTCIALGKTKNKKSASVSMDKLGVTSILILPNSNRAVLTLLIIVVYDFSSVYIIYVYIYMFCLQLEYKSSSYDINMYFWGFIMGDLLLSSFFFLIIV